MRIVKCEKIYLSQNEATTWAKFSQVLDGLEQGSENPNTIELINTIQGLMYELWEEVEEVE